jgi:hypothetical protein
LSAFASCTFRGLTRCDTAALVTDAWESYLDVTRGEQGGANNPDQPKDPGTGQFVPAVNRDSITVDGADKPPRDYSREAPTGTSVSYSLRRLSRKRPALGRPKDSGPVLDARR